MADHEPTSGVQRHEPRDERSPRRAGRGRHGTRRRAGRGDHGYRRCILDRRRHLRRERPRAVRREGARRRELDRPVDRRERQAGGRRCQRDRGGRGVLGRARRRHHHRQGVRLVPAGVRPDRPDARRWHFRLRGGRDRARPCDADGPPGRPALRPGGLRRRPDHARGHRRRLRGAGREGRPASGLRSTAGPDRDETRHQRGDLAALDDALERERTGQTLLLRTADVAEGMRAFSERRRPDFRGE